MPSVLPMSAAIAARTSSVRIGTGLALAPLYDPVRLAEDAATVDAISGGRFILGLGLGWLDWEFEALGRSLSKRASAMEMAIRVCREAWSDHLLSEEQVAVFPKPARADGPPIWIGGHAQAAVRRAGRIADGFLAGEHSPEELYDACVLIREELDAGGSNSEAFEVGGYWPVFTWENRDAFDLVKPWLHYMQWKYEDTTGARGRLTPRPMPPELDSDSEEALHAGLICGTPDDVATHIEELLDSVSRSGVPGGPFTFVGRHYYPGMPRNMMRDATRMFAEQVIPRFT